MRALLAALLAPMLRLLDDAIAAVDYEDLEQPALPEPHLAAGHYMRYDVGGAE